MDVLSWKVVDGLRAEAWPEVIFLATRWTLNMLNENLSEQIGFLNFLNSMLYFVHPLDT